MLRGAYDSLTNLLDAVTDSFPVTSFETPSDLAGLSSAQGSASVPVGVIFDLLSGSPAKTRANILLSEWYLPMESSSFETPSENAVGVCVGAPVQALEKTASVTGSQAFQRPGSITGSQIFESIRQDVLQLAQHEILKNEFPDQAEAFKELDPFRVLYSSKGIPMSKSF